MPDPTAPRLRKFHEGRHGWSQSLSWCFSPFSSRNSSTNAPTTEGRHKTTVIFNPLKVPQNEKYMTMFLRPVQTNSEL